MKIKDIAERIEKIVSLKLAQDWDNVGLLIGNPQQDVKNILLAIDITKDVLAEAKKLFFGQRITGSMEVIKPYIKFDGEVEDILLGSSLISSRVKKG